MQAPSGGKRAGAAAQGRRPQEKPREKQNRARGRVIGLHREGEPGADPRLKGERATARRSGGGHKQIARWELANRSGDKQWQRWEMRWEIGNDGRKSR